MIVLEGTAKTPGVAIAVGATVRAPDGIGSVTPSILENGIQAIKRRLSPVDYPEAVVVCDSLALGAGVRIPGVTTVGIAAQDEQDVPGLDVDVPCVIGVKDAPYLVSEGDAVIVDGNKGIVYIDPDPPTLIHYQQAEEQRDSRSRVFIGSEHIPAKTQSGEIVYVYACACDADEVDTALAEGADGLVLDLLGKGNVPADYFTTILQAAAGKPVVWILNELDLQLMNAATLYSVPHQITVLFPEDEFDGAMAASADLLQDAADAAYEDDLEPPQINFGVVTREPETAAEGIQSHMSIAIDLRSCGPEELGSEQLKTRLSDHVRLCGSDRLLVLVGEHEDAVGSVVGARATKLSVGCKMVADTKYVIRSIGTEEEA